MRVSGVTTFPSTLSAVKGVTEQGDKRFGIISRGEAAEESAVGTALDRGGEGDQKRRSKGYTMTLAAYREGLRENLKGVVMGRFVYAGVYDGDDWDIEDEFRDDIVHRKQGRGGGQQGGGRGKQDQHHKKKKPDHWDVFAEDSLDNF